jgi:hypothetical protein
MQTLTERSPPDRALPGQLLLDAPRVGAVGACLRREAWVLVLELLRPFVDSVRIPLAGHTGPLRAVLMVDAYPAARGDVR